MKNLYQGDEEGCGLSSLRMLLVHYSKNPNYRYLVFDTHPPYSLDALQRAAAKEGLDLAWKEVRDKGSLLNNKQWPVLLLLGKRNSPHCVLVLRKWKSRFLVCDSSRGKEWREAKEILFEWNGAYGETKGYVRHKCPYRKPQQRISISLVVSWASALLADFSLYAGFYFLDWEGNYLYSILLFSGYGIFEILRRVTTVQTMKAFDRKWLKHIWDPDGERLRKNYERYYSYKKGRFASLFDLFSGCFLALSLSILVGFNNPAFFASVAGLAIFSLLEALYFQKKLKWNRRGLESQERALFDSNGTKEAKINEIAKINEEAYRLGDYLTYGLVLYVGLALALALIPSFISGELSLNYYLFHFFALLGVGEAMKKAIAFFQDYEVRSSDYDYFLEYFHKNEKGG